MSSSSGPNSQSSSWRAQKATAADLSLLEKLDLIPALLSVFANTITAIFTGAIRSKDVKPPSFYRYMVLTALRTLVRRTTVRQQHYFSAPTDDAYAIACKKRGVQPHSEILEDGTKAHWVGSSKAEKLILNFHGGGYVVPAAPEFFEFMFRVVDFCKAQGKDVACLMPAYDLAPGRPYPRQLQQAALVLNHVLDKLHYSPQNIVLTGDSAGANLVLSLLSHINHPHPSTTLSIPPIKLEGEFKGAVLISPWVSFDNNKDSYKRNKYKDCLNETALKQWSTAFLLSTPESDNYSQPILAPPSWWNGLSISSILIVSGSDEVLIDGITEFEKKLSEGFGKDKVEFQVVKGEYHDQPSLDIQFGYTKPEDEGKQARIIKEWVSSKL